ncbi:hypothetical protein PFLmoz3_03753 [Pseudomonas fluorescens]|uniref:Uncharacterized protein n=1 Tax=Pseudomonas fluorescens TaxID=294 RepID=A0A120G741_PSEFL|nr:hypothetical protein PFLmoz3_03753 [Pseudomonas fluorescens]
MAAELARNPDPRCLPGPAADRTLWADVRLPLLHAPGPAPAEQSVDGRHPADHPVRPAPVVRQHLAAEHHHLCPGRAGGPEHAVCLGLSLAKRLPPGALVRGGHGGIQHRHADHSARTARPYPGGATGADRHPVELYLPQWPADEPGPRRAPARHCRNPFQPEPRPGGQQCRNRRQSRVPGEDQPRNPHAHERCAGHDRVAAGHAVVGEATRLCADHPQRR